MNALAKVGSISKDSSSTFLLIATAITVKGLVLFVGLPLFQALTSSSDYQADMFPDKYDLIATNLIEGNGYRFLPDMAETTIRSPGFVIVLAAIFWAFGKSLAALKAFNLVLSTVTAYVVYRLGLRITDSARVSAVAALLYFFFPGTIVSDSRGGIETLFTLCIALFMLLVYRALKRNKIADYAAAGACFGALMLVKSSAGLFPVVLLIYLLVIRPGTRMVKAELARLTMFMLAAALIMSPWVIRNAELTGRFIPTMSVSSLAAFQGLYVAKNQGRGKEHFELLNEAVTKQNEIAREMGMPFRVEETPFYPQFYSTEDELRYYDHLGELVKEEFWRYPSVLLKAVAYNAVAFWIQGRTTTATFLNAIVSGPFFILALVGAGLGIRRKYHIVPLVLFILTFYIAHLPIIAMARYYIPLVPLISIFAAISTTWLIDRLHVRFVPSSCAELKTH